MWPRGIPPSPPRITSIQSSSRTREGLFPLPQNVDGKHKTDSEKNEVLHSFINELNNLLERETPAASMRDPVQRGGNLQEPRTRETKLTIIRNLIISTIQCIATGDVPTTTQENHTLLLHIKYLTANASEYFGKKDLTRGGALVLFILCQK